MNKSPTGSTTFTALPGTEPERAQGVTKPRACAVPSPQRVSSSRALATAGRSPRAHHNRLDRSLESAGPDSSVSASSSLGLGSVRTQDPLPGPDSPPDQPPSGPTTASANLPALAGAATVDQGVSESPLDSLSPLRGAVKRKADSMDSCGDDHDQDDDTAPASSSSSWEPVTGLNPNEHIVAGPLSYSAQFREPFPEEVASTSASLDEALAERDAIQACLDDYATQLTNPNPANPPVLQASIHRHVEKVAARTRAACVDLYARLQALVERQCPEAMGGVRREYGRRVEGARDGGDGSKRARRE